MTLKLIFTHLNTISNVVEVPVHPSFSIIVNLVISPINFSFLQFSTENSQTNHSWHNTTITMYLYQLLKLLYLLYMCIFFPKRLKIPNRRHIILNN